MISRATRAIGAIVLTGSEKAFAAGADIKEMVTKSYPEIYLEDFITSGWERVGQCRKAGRRGGCRVRARRRLRDRDDVRHRHLPPKMPDLGSPRLRSARCPASAGRSALPALSARRRRWICA